MGTAISKGESGPILLAVALGAYAVVMVAGIWYTWRRESRAYAQRISSGHLAAAPATR